MNTLKAEKRDMSIKAKRLRREGYVTGNVFGKEITGSIPIKLEKSAVDRLLKIHRRGSQVMLDVDGESMDVLLKEINFNPLKGQVDEIDFQALVKGEKVQSVAEVILENHDKVASGVLQLLLEEVPYRALPGDLIEKVMVDVGNLKVGDSIKVGDLDMAKNEKVDLLIDPETIIVTVSESRNAVEEDTGEEAEGGEA